MGRRSRPEADCPHCGATFPASRLACPECGSDAETGWSEDSLTGYSAVDIPDTFDEDDYRDVVADLPGGPAPRNVAWRLVGVVVVLGFVVGFVARC